MAVLLNCDLRLFCPYENAMNSVCCQKYEVKGGCTYIRLTYHNIRKYVKKKAEMLNFYKASDIPNHL